MQEITQATGRYCLQSLEPQFAHLWLELVESVSITFCVLAIVRFYTIMVKSFKPRRALSKIIAFKIIVGIRFFQSWIFSTLLQHNVIKVGKMFSYNGMFFFALAQRRQPNANDFVSQTSFMAFPPP